MILIFSFYILITALNICPEEVCFGAMAVYRIVFGLTVSKLALKQTSLKRRIVLNEEYCYSV
jgi:hypothetical protein